jgi:hypothetical protein
MHLKVFLKLKKLSLLGKYIFIKPKKKTKNPLGWVFFNPGFFQPCLVGHGDLLELLAGVRVLVWVVLHR